MGVRTGLYLGYLDSTYADDHKERPAGDSDINGVPHKVSLVIGKDKTTVQMKMRAEEKEKFLSFVLIPFSLAERVPKNNNCVVKRSVMLQNITCKQKQVNSA